jgi:DNA-binding NtrC family response regulator
MRAQESILFIDDDPLFRALIKKSAQKRGLPVTVCADLGDLDPWRTPSRFHAIVTDYYLDGMKDQLKGTHLAELWESVPILLVSSSDHCIEANIAWPVSIRKFLNKRVGVDAILDEAMKL